MKEDYNVKECILEPRATCEISEDHFSEIVKMVLAVVHQENNIAYIAVISVDVLYQLHKVLGYMKNVSGFE